ncbi:hypothetical protein GCM10011594_43620 [Nakamurella endophytica]|uniref:Uncharacterized protein n=1 Tax=Nakamurella endophytica TaxID=1748367 RepID=A0A917WPK7_9ACTN|nr:hypothetical protein GCM10011594_43620 [Nakamurella endophytica]
MAVNSTAAGQKRPVSVVEVAVRTDASVQCTPNRCGSTAAGLVSTDGAALVLAPVPLATSVVLDAAAVL